MKEPLVILHYDNHKEAQFYLKEKNLKKNYDCIIIHNWKDNSVDVKLYNKNKL